MNHVLRDILPLALGSAVSPLLFIVQIMVITGKRHPIARALAVLAGGTSAVFLITAVFLLIGHGPLPTGRVHPDTLTVTLRGLGAVLLVVLGIRNFGQRDTGSPSGSSRLSRRLATARGRSYATIGFIIMITNFTSLVLFIPALHATKSSDIPLGDQVLLVSMLIACILLPLVIPLLLVAVTGPRAPGILASLNRVMTTHHATISAVVCFGFAAYLGYGALRAMG